MGFADMKRVVDDVEDDPHEDQGVQPVAAPTGYLSTPGANGSIAQTTENMRRIGYLRVSTEEQRPDRQIDGLKAICDEFHVETLSAVSKSRPVYEKIVRHLKSGDILVVWDFDRAYRSAADALTEINALNKRGIGFRIANFPLDTSTPEGYLLLTILSGMAEFERRILSRRTKEGITAARKRGKVIGRPRKLNERQVSDACKRVDANEITVTAMANTLKVGSWTLTKEMKRYRERSE